MGKIIDDRDVPLYAPDFLPPFDPLESFQALGNSLCGNAQVVRHGDNRQCVEQVVGAHEWGLKRSQAAGSTEYLEACPWRPDGNAG